MRRFHLAIGVTDITASIADYSHRFECEPVVIIADTYALFRTPSLNVSIRKVDADKTGFRHLGWEDEQYKGFREEKDGNGLTWEYFEKDAQINEIVAIWPGSVDANPYLKKDA